MYGGIRRLRSRLTGDPGTRSSARIEDAALKREVLKELVVLHAQVLKRMPLIQLFVVVGQSLVVFQYVPTAMFLGWGILTLAMESLRAACAAWVLRRVDSIDPRRVHFYFVVLATLAGGVVGLGAVLFLPRIPILAQALTGIILFVMPAAGVAVSVSSKYILAAYSFFILFLASATWAFIYPSQALAVSVLPTLYWVFMISIAADGEKLLLRSVIIRQERDRMVKDLEQSNLDVRAAMDKTEQSAQARARVLAAASHDLRQPLHALSIYSAILAANPAPDTLREVGQNIDQIVRSLGNLLSGLLDLSRLSVGYYVPEKQIFDFDKTVNEVCAEYESSTPDKNLVLVRELSPVRLCGDPIAVARIARNLLDNAIKYTDQGEVRITTRADGPCAVLTVADTGKGIPLAEQSRVFEEFYQIDNPGRDRSKGVGLGLAIVQRLCELLEAKISIESEFGRGTRFDVTFPGVAVTPIDTPGAASSSERAPLRGLRIYVIDDEIDIVKSMGALLQIWGVDAKTAGSPQVAENIYRQFGKPDLLIADLRLGTAEHGAELATRLQRTFGSHPVLIITGETASSALRKANEAGYPLLQKPIAPEILRDAIQAALESPALRQ